ncbi:MAG TPA: leucyl aminopeptidase [Longimicrobiales bacterium]|nr:leucyl aminopeptidase [Longimicrobiales bacterium]
MAELQIRTVHAPIEEIRTPLLVLHIFERDRSPVGFVAKVDQLYDGAISRVLQSGDFTGRKEDTLLLYPPSGTPGVERVLLVGVGKREEHTAERLRRAVGVAVRQAEKLNITDIALSVGHVHHLSEGMGDYFAGLAAVQAAVLASWNFREMKSQPAEDEPRGELSSITLLAHEEREARDFERACRDGGITARAENLARELQTRPGNVVTPTYLGERAQQIGRDVGLQVTVLDRKALEKEGMHALLAVGQGSAQEPRLIVMEHRKGPKGARPLVLVGKGISFDTGGISLKPPQSMEDMKYDMSGAAAVIAAMRGIAELELEIDVVGIVASAENMPSGTAVKPGDVIGSHLGKTIEVINTDAEGRLVLADALSWARRYEPAAIVDAATLTGAIVIALGHHGIGLMGNDGHLLNELTAVGLRVGERCWKLPLWDVYREQIDSQIADIKNTGGRPAGSITAGWFLKEFVEDHVPWAHMDIAGTAYRDEPVPYLRKGATGWPTRLFIEWVRARAEA